MARGPLPKPDGQRRRRNAPTIPTTALPLGGATSSPPKVPSFVPLGDAGKAFYRWAWRTPQAAAWHAGMALVVARRAQLEDDLAALAAVEGLDLTDLEPTERGDNLADLIKRVAALATGRVQVLRLMLDLDRQLGLTPKAQADLRWSIDADSAAAEPDTGAGEPPAPGVTNLDRWRRSS